MSTTSDRVATPDAAVADRRADLGTHFEVEQLYYREADLLDEHRFVEWLDLLADDLVYWMPTRTDRLRRQQDRSVAARGEAAYYDETKASLQWRIRRFESGSAWSEDPPSRTRHLITNVRVRHAVVGDDLAGPDLAEPGLGPAEAVLVARSNFLVYRNRLQREENVFAGERTDLLRRAGGGLLIARRTVLLDQNVLLAKNISTFF
ncbi:3-phenylpropionate/cinnamic acid dioxygenase, small subunit [Parafrankia irregularis]|uniref:3-phenylpropionate/cinnamic acid dioxygenase, small subunit n=1 Tax=Parafrankia irregularis TaxID=795642 RepID=A0A0S4QHY0_9ACTN|nr:MULTISPECIES: 3-phenylpropionate/cinnamic acid dioxygenase subunit beta [Parafrankia]MBE3204080.1 3-phenylpropionate/cinnamic acid dioxygenase subunit beta [Parafrankia sp. CH37]CUU55044.1 3-phenylpropionate/cinnamic acid dioxygenase, small subunit [Parafrankia irregularis]